MYHTNTHIYDKDTRNKNQVSRWCGKKWWRYLADDVYLRYNLAGERHFFLSLWRHQWCKVSHKIILLECKFRSFSQKTILVSWLGFLDGNNECWLLLQLCGTHSKNRQLRKLWSLGAHWTHHMYCSAPLTPKVPCQSNSLSYIFSQTCHNQKIAAWYTIGTKDVREDIVVNTQGCPKARKQITYPYFSSLTRVKYALLSAVSASHKTNHSLSD